MEHADKFEAASRLKRLQELLRDLQGKLTVKKRADTLADIKTAYEQCSAALYSSANETCKVGDLLEVLFEAAAHEAKDNETKRQKQVGGQKLNAIHLLVVILQDVSCNSEILEEEQEVLKTVLSLLRYDGVQADEYSTRNLAEIVNNIVRTVGVPSIHEDDLRGIWTISWSRLKQAQLNDYTTGIHLKTVTMVLQDLSKTVLSLRLEENLVSAVEIFFETVAKWKSSRWPNRINSAVLDFCNILIDHYGLLIRDLLLDKLFALAPTFLSRIGADSSDTGLQDYTFFDKLASLAFPDCQRTSLVDERVFGVASTAVEHLISDVVQLSTVRPDFTLPECKAPLFAKLLVIAQTSSAPQGTPSTSKRSRITSPLESLLENVLDAQCAINKTTIFILLEEIVRMWSHRLGEDVLSSIAETMLKVDKKELIPHTTAYCRVLTELILCGAMGNSSKVKAEAGVANPMRDPRVTIKAVWKLATSAAHGQTTATAAMDLMMALLARFKEILAPEGDDQLVETIATVLSSQTSSKSLELLSKLLTLLEFDELKAFSGAENRESGMANWSFRCQVAERLVEKFDEDVSAQLYQLCCYHPQPQPSRAKCPPPDGHFKLEDSLELSGLISRKLSDESRRDEQLAACLNHDLVEYVANLVLDRFAREDSNETRLSLFTTTLSFCNLLQNSGKLTGNKEVLAAFEPLLMTVNEWLSAYIHDSTAADLTKLNPGQGNRFVSIANRRSLQEKADECQVLYARFPTEQEVPAAKMKRFLADSVEMIRTYGDFSVAPQVPRVKMETGEQRFCYNKTMDFSLFLAESVVKFIEEKMDFLPDVLLLLHSAQSILQHEHVERIAGKAQAVILEDEADDTAEESLLKKKMSRDAFQDPLFSLMSHQLPAATVNSTLTESEAHQLLQNAAVPLIIRQAVVRKILTNLEHIDGAKIVNLVKRDGTLLKIIHELFPDFVVYDRAFGQEAVIVQQLKKGNTDGALSLLKSQAETYRTLRQSTRIVPIIRSLGDVFAADTTPQNYQLIALISCGMAAGRGSKRCQEALFPVIRSLLQKCSNSLAVRQILMENFDEIEGEEKDKDELSRICQGIIDRMLNGGDIQTTLYVLTRLFWAQLKASLSTPIVRSLETQGAHLYDQILFYWDMLPHLRTHIAETLPVFDQSRENTTRRGGFGFDEFRKCIEEYCSVRLADVVSLNQGEVRSCLKVLRMLGGNEDDEQVDKDSQRFSQSMEVSPFAPFCQKLIGKALKEADGLKDEERKLLKLVGELHWATAFWNIMAPYLCHVCPGAGIDLIQLSGTIQIDPSTDQRLIRTLAECVDGCGLDKLALLELDGSKLIRLGHVLLSGGYSRHAFAVANLAFDRYMGKGRNLAAFGGGLPTEEGVWQLLGTVYLETKNCEALDSLPRHMQDNINVQLVRVSAGCQWLQVAHSPVTNEEQKLWAKWFCGIDCNPKEDNLKYMDAVISGKWGVGYPKRIDSHHKRLYALIKNQNQYERVMAETIQKLYLDEMARCDAVPVQLAKNLYDLEIVTRSQMTESFLQSLSLEQLSLLMWKVYRHCLFVGGPAAATSSTYKECFLVTALLVLEKLKRKKAFVAALSILPVIHSIVATDKLAVMRLTVKECEIHIGMGHHQLAENKLYNLSNVIELQESEDKSKVSPEEVDIGIDVVCLLSQIRAEHSSKNVEQAMIPLKALNTCNMTNDRAVQHVYSMALRQLQEMEAFMESPMIKLRKEARERHKKELQALRYSGASSADDQRRQRVIGKEYSCENEELSRLDRKLVQSACFALQSAVDLLEFICSGLDKKDPLPEGLKDKSLRVLFPLIDLIFRYEQNQDVVVIFKSNLGNFPCSLWLPTVPHILPHCFRNGPLSDAISSLMVQMLVAYPFHTVLSLLAYKFNQKKPCSDRATIVDTLLLKAVRQERSLEPVLKDLVDAHTVYREFVWLPLKKDEVADVFELVSVKGKEKYKISKAACLFANIDLLRRVPIPTVTQPVGKAKDYSRDKLILWAHVDPHCDKADGNSSPKILRVKGSNGLVYKLVWKDGESVRQDSLVQDLFSVMNSLLETDQPLRTYNVVPLDSLSGIIEFCGGTQSIKDLLIGADSRGGLHREIHSKEDVYAVRKKMMQIQVQERTIISTEQFKDLLQEVTPVFRHHFYRSFPRVYDWTQMIKNYTKSLAQWSIVCYVVGLGDRHASNVLFETKTSNFVHIDLGMVLEFSRRMLPIPELVPFRLTRDLLDPILVQGIRGNLASEAADALDKMRKNKDVILGAASVFLRETISNFKDTADDKQRSFASATAYGRLQAKLNGTDSTISPVSAVDQTNRLLSEATDLENMAKLFNGWLAIV